jgi:hypothetical protein
MVLIETKKEQLSAIVNAYQALGGGASLVDLLHWDSVALPANDGHSWLPSWLMGAEELPAPATKVPAGTDSYPAPTEALPPPAGR